jgi:carboxyl-terminal processing protease
MQPNWLFYKLMNLFSAPTHCVRFFRTGLLLVLSLPLLLSAEVTSEPAETATESTTILPAIATTRRMQLETRKVLNIIQELHILNINFREMDYDKLVDNYLSRLDGTRMYLLESDVHDALERFAKPMQGYLNNGNLYPAFQMFDTYRNRVLERFEWIQERMKGDFDLESGVSFETNRKESSWPATQEEADQLWEKRLALDLIRNLLTDKEMDAAKQQVTQQYERAKRNLLSLEGEDVQEIFLSSIMQMFDPHSSFMSANMTEDLTINMQSSLEGIGAILRDEDGTCVIHELVPPGPAYRSGQISPRDKIIGVGQESEEIEDIQGLPLRKVVNKIRGKSGTVVTLLIQPGNSDDPADRKIVHLTREKIQLTSSLAKATLYDIPQGDRTLKIGVIELPSFYGSKETNISATKDVEELVQKLMGMGIDGLILDLRDNGGGLLYEAISMTGLFIKTGPVVAVRDFQKKISVSHDYNPKIVYEGPMIVLTSKHSASAAEILAGALQSYGRALVVGDSSTHGKGTVQVVLPIAQEGGLSTSIKLTNSQFFLPNGSSTQIKGVASDIVIPSVNEVLDVGEASYTNAIAWDELNATMWNYSRFRWDDVNGVTPPLIEYLKGNSQKRVDSLDEYQLLKDYIQKVDAQRKQTNMVLSLSGRLKEKEEWEQFRKDWRHATSELAKKEPFQSQSYELSVVEDLERTTQELEKSHEKPAPETKPEPKKSSSDVPADDITSVSDEEDSDYVRLDFSLRESLRILADWIEYIQQAKQFQYTETALQNTGTGNP